MAKVPLVLMIAAALCFALVALGWVPSTKANLEAAGLCLWVIACICRWPNPTP